jgi:hypothetical protein
VFDHSRKAAFPQTCRLEGPVVEQVGQEPALLRTIGAVLPTGLLDRFGTEIEPHGRPSSQPSFPSR